MTPHKPTSSLRRQTLTGLGVLAVGTWVWAAPRMKGLFGEELTFTPISGAPGFQRLDTNLGGFSAAMFTGLEPTDPDVRDALEVISLNPCHALYRGSKARVPIALFSDFNCPNCPQMDANVAAVAARTPDTSLHFHQLPLLGRTSVVASKAVLAAAMQDKYHAMHAALLRTPAVTNLALIRRFADQIGADPDRLLADMDHPDITRSLTQSAALAKYLGLIGTPATVIGKTVVLGVQTEATIAKIIAHDMKRDTACN